MQLEPVSHLSDPWAIGTVVVRNRVVLAPMSGVTDLPFRRLAHRFGAGLVVTEMIASRELVGDSGDSRRRMAQEKGVVHVVQLAGRDASWMAEAARIAEGEGADVIDINMGCPAKKVIGGYSGSALMRDPDHALSLVDATIAAVSVPVTVKMRLGWDENSINAPAIAARAENAGAAMITVHGRTREQFYEGRADWNAIRAVRDAISIPLVANGDVATTADCEAIMAASGANAVMVGRAAQGQPWLPGALAGSGLAPSSAAGILDVVIEHYEAMLAHYGTELGLRCARKHLGWYLGQHCGDVSAAMRSIVMGSRDPQAVIAALSELFLGSEISMKPTAYGEAA
ncbi:tRNA dihydrouridine synthase DusB [Rhizobium sp. EC-SD404]|uniref:tRNA dihydrouridine synthase DusB n=1 Tax=Rhizobium sp. EC-SD404 TaxID=2038389 RepID=UPI00125A62FA|nr:tRNA dihydrouridine synthase DusB [Rhizobium sp. EC-SD404]VVT19507.1 putative tRNA-dihydrouridine synthase [Rhizobium sp. EC-SD404]